MNKATTIKQIYHIFAPEKALTIENKNFYIDLYGEEFKDFITALENNEDKRKTFFLAGQSGNGKSTALNLLRENYEKLENIYTFKHIAGRTIFLYEDIDIVDILLMVGNAIIKNNEILKQKYFKELTKIEDVKDGILEEYSSNSTQEDSNLGITSKVGVGAKFFSILNLNADFEASYKINEEIRLDARRLFKIRRKELIELTNNIILDYQIENNDKKILIIIDDLEKKDNVDNLFLKDMPLLNELDIVKIITMPIHLHRAENFPNADIREFGLKLKTIEGNEHAQDIDFLKQVILARIEGEIISTEAINQVIKYSGANLRQLMRLIHISAEKVLGVEGKKIDKQDIDNAMGKMQKDYSPKVMAMLSFLNEIVENKTSKDTKSLAKATKRELIFAKFNAVTWYELNPVCEKSLSTYNKLNENISN